MELNLLGFSLCNTSHWAHVYFEYRQHWDFQVLLRSQSKLWITSMLSLLRKRTNQLSKWLSYISGYTQRKTGLYTILWFKFVVILSILSDSHSAGTYNWKSNNVPRNNFNQLTVFSYNNCILKQEVSLSPIEVNLEAFKFTLFCLCFKSIFLNYIPPWFKKKFKQEIY